MHVRAHGIGLRMPQAWDARLYRREADEGEQTFPILHAGTFPLPNNRGDYGSGAVDVMRATDVLVSLVEFEPEAAGRPLFSRRGIPRVRPEDFNPQALQRTIPGQSGCQYFFHHEGRAFCLYVVLGSHARRTVLARRANELIAGLELS